jgi:hypothetical protein
LGGDPRCVGEEPRGREFLTGKAAGDARCIEREGKCGIQSRRVVSCRGLVSARRRDQGLSGVVLRVLAACGSGHAAYGVGDICDDTELATAERAACDVDVEDAFESLRP